MWSLICAISDVKSRCYRRYAGGAAFLSYYFLLHMLCMLKQNKFDFALHD